MPQNEKITFLYIIFWTFSFQLFLVVNLMFFNFLPMFNRFKLFKSE